MLTIKIKASDITNLTDARYFAAKDVEWLSFNFMEGAASYIEPMKARAIFEWVEGPIIVGEFGHMTADEINFYTEGWGLKAVQVGYDTTAETIAAIKNGTIIKDFQIEVFTNTDYLRGEMSNLATLVEAFQLSFDKNGIAWSDLKSPQSMITVDDLRILCTEFKIILSIDFDLQDLDEILSLNVYGLNLRGGEEERVGVKSFDELDEVLDILESVE